MDIKIEKCPGTTLNRKIEKIRLPLKDIDLNEGQIEGLPANPRNWTKDELKSLALSLTETPELFEMRCPIVVPHEGRYVVLGGNLRIAAARENKEKEVTCFVFNSTSIEKMKEIVIKDNGAWGKWDYDALANEWSDLPLSDWGIPVWEESPQETAAAAGEEKQASEDDFDENKDAIAVKCKRGDVWVLGDHRLMCGDSISLDDVKKLMGGVKADLVFTDPPYGMKKEIDGVLNDNLNYDDLLKFNEDWIPLSFAFLKDNGSWYCWGTDEPLMDIYSNILKPMIKTQKITFRNLLTWDKGDGQGQLSDGFRMYPIADEKCLFVMCGVQGFNVNSDNYYEGWEPIRSYLNEEAEKCGGHKIWKKMLGNQMGKHYFTKSQWLLPTKEAYEKMQAFGRDYDAFKKEYEVLKKEWYSTRAYFNNTHDNMNNVWHFARASQEERQDCGGHATPKPIALCARAIKSSSREGESVLDLFGGSGTTLIAAEQLGRKCFMMELDPHYCDVIIARWEKLTGKTATLEQ